MATDRYTQCLAKRDKSAAMQTPDHFVIFYPPQKFAKDIINKLYIGGIFEQIAKTVKQLHLLFRSYKPIVSQQLDYRIHV